MGSLKKKKNTGDFKSENQTMPFMLWCEEVSAASCPRKHIGEDKEEMQKVTASLASASEISVAVTVVVVLSEMEFLFIIR